MIQFAKKTGDYSVLSHADLSVLALTYALDVKEKQQAEAAGEGAQVRPLPSLIARVALSELQATSNSGAPTDVAQETESETTTDQTEEKTHDAEIGVKGAQELEAQETDAEAQEPPESETPSSSELDEEDEIEAEDHEEREPLDVELHPIKDQEDQSPENAASSSQPPSPTTPTNRLNAQPEPIYDDPSDEEDGEGEWITPSNVALHKSRALNLLPSEDGKKGKSKQEHIPVGCMTADFAMQNVLLQMGLGLVSVEGKRIERVKSWVLRCHACFK